MAARTTEAGSTRSRAAVAAAFACLAAGVVAIGATTPADAINAKQLGKTKKTPRPSCPTPGGNDFPPRKGCQVLGEVTGFQKKANGRQGLMRVPKNGRIVAWAVDLSKPDKQERNFFEDVLGNEAFGGAPSARLAMLTRANKKKYRLRAQSPNVKLNGLMGRRQYFTLRNPIPVKKDWIAAITTFTWVPAFAHDLDNDDLWKASRTRKRCEGTRNLTKRSKPHKGVGSTRAYGCTYEHARILYWAYFVPNN